MSHVPPSHEDAREPLQLPLGNAGSEPVIAVDAMGGDYAPDEIVAGALAAQLKPFLLYVRRARRS